MADIAVPKLERELVEIAAPKIESVTQMWDRAQFEFYWAFLRELFKTDPVFKIVQPKLFGSLNMPVSILKRTTSQIDAVASICWLLIETGFSLGDFDAKDLRQCSID